MTISTELRRYLGRQAAEEPTDRRNPFPGARPFRPDETAWFHGRRSEVAAVAALVRAQRFCLLYAPSGAGKSSMINAGLLARIAFHPGGGETTGEGDFDVVGIAKVHPSALRGPDGWPSSEEVSNVYVTAALNSLATDTSAPYTTLAELFADRPTAHDQFGDPIPRLLVLDQFEEILEPFGRDDWLTCRNDFFDQLDGVLRNDLTVHVLVAIREDHLATIERLTAGMKVPFQASYRLDKLSIAAARHAIERPAESGGMVVEPAVTDRLVTELARRRIEELDREVPDEFIEPGQLQVVCNRLWARADADPANHQQGLRPAIRISHVEDAGGVAGSLRKYYDDAVTSVARGRELATLRRFIERQLISPRGTRQLVPFDPDATRTGRVRNETLARLEDPYGLVRRERRGGTVYWELSHDGFVEPIRRANLAAWDARRQRRGKVAWGVAAVVLAIAAVWSLAARPDDEPPATASPAAPALQQYPVGPRETLPLTVAIGTFQQGDQVLVELVQPQEGTATASLWRVDGEGVAGGALPATPEQIDMQTYAIDVSGYYEVLVEDRDGAPRTALGINVRPGATIVQLPDVIGIDVEDANRLLATDGRAGTVGVRSVCSSLADVPAGETLRVIDDARTAVRGVDGVLAALTPEGIVPSEPVYVATGASFTVEAADGTRCGARPPGSVPG